VVKFQIAIGALFKASFGALKKKEKRKPAKKKVEE